MDHTLQAPGVDLITQEYLAARRELRSRTDLAPTQREKLKEELADEHRLRCATEWKIVVHQLQDDRDLLDTPNIRTSENHD
jgi:hypothetical protein